jgi:TolB protein
VTNPAGSNPPYAHPPPFPHNDIAPSYAPSGEQIVFASDRAHPDLCYLDLYIANADGSNPHRITTALPGAVDPIWGRAP